MRKKRYYYNGRRCSKGEKRIIDYLNSENIKFSKEHIFKDCINERSNYLRFDFYLPELNLVIEYQGQHHFRPVNKYRRAKRVHEQIVISDQIKKEYLKNKNIKLLEISYKDYENVEMILENTLCQT